MTKLVAVDQYGGTVFIDADKPRKSLCDLYAVPSSSAQKMYVDTNSGESKHVGYIVCGLWFTFYKLNEWSK